MARTSTSGLLAAAAILLSSCGTPTLEKGNWAPRTYEALSSMIELYGKGSPSYDKSCPPYAVFDYDNTTIMNDIAVSTFVYQIENLDFKFTPGELPLALGEALSDLDVALNTSDTTRVHTPRTMIEQLQRDYEVLYPFRERAGFGKAIPAEELSRMHSLPEYLDFRARLYSLSLGIDRTLDVGTSCAWIVGPFHGMSVEEMQECVRRNVDNALSLESIYSETWTTPDGLLNVSVRKGMVLPKENIDLYNTLRRNGFRVYICSASLEELVEAMACSPKYGLGMREEDVYGIRMKSFPDGKVHAVLDSSYAQTYREGKTECIRTLIAPSNCGNGPSLVGGDSSGDYSMLTSFDDLRVGLIFNVGSSSIISTLYDKAYRQEREGMSVRNGDTPLYVLQGRDLGTKSLVPSFQSR